MAKIRAVVGNIQEFLLQRSGTAKRITLVLLLCACVIPTWRVLGHVVAKSDASIWPDVLLGTALLAVIPFFLAAYGGHIAAEAIPEESRQRSVKVKFWGLCLFGVLLAFVQQYRSVSQQAKAESKNDRAQDHIISMLGDLHGTEGVMTEAERRKKILDVLREKYILSHDVDQSMIDGTEAPPSEWVNAQLKALGENWSVSKQVSILNITPRQRSYLTAVGQPVFTGRNPNNVEGSNFQAGDRLGFNIHFRSTGPVSLGASAFAAYIEDATPEGLNAAYKAFRQEIQAERKVLPRPTNEYTEVLVPGESRFNTAYGFVGPVGGQRSPLILSQDDLDALRFGSKVAVVISFMNYKDGNQAHRLWTCEFLQPPAQPPGIWHYLDVCPTSD